MKHPWVLAVILLVAGLIGWGVYARSGSMTGPGVSPSPTNAVMLESQNDTQVAGQDVVYFENVTGYYVAPTEIRDGGYPGIVMIHEWWGLNDHIRSMAQSLAKEGYQVLAVDLFEGSVATTQQEAQTQTSSLNQEEAVANLKAAVSYLRDEKDAPKVASLGWCFGGGQSLQLSVAGADLDATIVYYGNLITDEATLAAIDWPVLGIFAEQDMSIPPATVREFEIALNERGIENSITIYPGVGHAFANPSGANYAPEPTRDAWAKTLAFLTNNLK